MFSESLKKDELISTEHLSITDVSKNSVNSEPFNSSKYSLNDQQFQIYIGSDPQESFLDKSILAQWAFFC